MTGRWLRPREEPAGTAAVPDGLRVYAIGDIHGRADLLGTMAALIEADLADRPAASALTIFLGDYIDRGPASSAVIERLARGAFPTGTVALRGNHDAIFLDVLAGRTDLDYYDQLGGEATLQSYGLDLWTLDAMDLIERAAALQAAVPAAHIGFFEATAFSREVGDYFFCHAGARPGIDLASQTEHDLIWIREDFLHSTYDFGKIIVHGHTPVRSPEVRRNGINVDTKAFASGRLTAVVLEGTQRRFLQT